jgi:alkylhydroperoxidase family enzyme
MSPWLSSASEGKSAFEQRLAIRPDLLGFYREFYGELWRGVPGLPTRIIELCRLRIAQVHDCPPESAVSNRFTGVSPEDLDALSSWQTSDGFSEAEKACLRVAEKIPWDYHSIDDDEVDLLRSFFGDRLSVRLLCAMVLFDMNSRLRLVLEVDTRPTVVESETEAVGGIY